MINQKQHWENLAQKNSKYYINSDCGRNITEEQFRKSGKIAYKQLVIEDGLIKDGGSIVDFGCGTGRMSEFMAKDFKKVIGLDISRTMIAQGKQRLKKLQNVKLLETDGKTIPLPNNSVDLVFSYLVFQHIKTRSMVKNTFKEIYRILKPYGIFKVLLRSDTQKDMNRWWSGVEYNEQSIKKVYAKIGFSLLKVEYMDKYAFWLWLQK